MCFHRKCVVLGPFRSVAAAATIVVAATTAAAATATKDRAVAAEDPDYDDDDDNPPGIHTGAGTAIVIAHRVTHRKTLPLELFIPL